MAGPGFTFTLPHFTFITHTLHHNTTLNTYTRPCHFLILTDTHHPEMWPTEVVQKMDYTLASIHSKVGPKHLQFAKSQH